MVDEARHVALARRVEDLVAAQRHEVEVVARPQRAPHELLVVQHLADVLHDERVPDDTVTTNPRTRHTPNGPRYSVTTTPFCKIISLFRHFLSLKKLLLQPDIKKTVKKKIMTNTLENLINGQDPGQGITRHGS